MNYAEESLKKHYEWKGKIEMVVRAPLETKEDLSLAYTPGVAQPCLEIQKNVDLSYDLTRRSNLVAVVTDGTAVLGLGDIGPEAGMPVMEGKCALFKAFGANSLTDLYTFLNKVETSQEVLNESGEVIGTQIVPDLENSIYIDWGSFINAVINFFLIAFVLFCIVRIFNRIRNNHKEATEKLKKTQIPKADRKAMKAEGIKLRNKAAVAAWYAAKAEAEAAAAAAAEAEAAEQARLDRLANPTTEDLLKDIRSLLMAIAPEGAIPADPAEKSE